MKLKLAASAGAVALATTWLIKARLKRKGVQCSPLRYAWLWWRLRNSDDLIIVADFDRTITTAGCGISSHGVLERCKELSKNYRDATEMLLKHYYPIEIDPSLTREQKIPIMEEWYMKAHTLLLNEQLTENILQAAADDAPIALRPGFVELLRAAKARGVPFIICSAGLGNVVRAVLKTQLPPELGAEELPVVSNWVRFEKGGGTICGFTEPLIHMYNKDGATIKKRLGADAWASISAGGRSTALLLGDSLGDATMADGMDMANICRVGFLNESQPDRVASRLDKFRRAFDAVLVGDISMDWVAELCELKR